MDKQSIRNIKSMNREDLVDLGTDLGSFIRKNWLYSEESPLIKHLLELGMKDCEQDDLVRLIIEVFWEYLNGEEFEENRIIEKLQNLPSDISFTEAMSLQK